MKTRRFIQCDVFTPIPTQGNALAVVLDGECLTDDQMQRFAAWTNLAETTFLLPPVDPAADYRVRIFTTVREMPFAGHPTLGSCAAWLHAGGKPKEVGIVRQECAIGLIEIDISVPDRPAFTAPPTRIDSIDPDKLAAITDALGLQASQIRRHAQLDNGPVWQAFELDSAQTVLSLDSSKVRWPQFQSIGLIGAHPAGSEADFEVRMLAPSSGMSEDPITGSLNAALAHWMRADNRLSAPIVVAQGTRIERQGRVFVTPDETQGSVRIGGQTHMLIDGTVSI